MLIGSRVLTKETSKWPLYAYMSDLMKIYEILLKPSPKSEIVKKKSCKMRSKREKP